MVLFLNQLCSKGYMNDQWRLQFSEANWSPSLFILIQSIQIECSDLQFRPWTLPYINHIAPRCWASMQLCAWVLWPSCLLLATTLFEVVGPFDSKATPKKTSCGSSCLRINQGVSHHVACGLPRAGDPWAVWSIKLVKRLVSWETLAIPWKNPFKHMSCFCAIKKHDMPRGLFLYPWLIQYLQFRNSAVKTSEPGTDCKAMQIAFATLYYVNTCHFWEQVRV